VSAVVAAAPEVVALVGCDPVAFARDLASLTERGYRCEQVAVIDLFPDTHHVECVGRLVRDGSGTLSR
jgi:tRNA/tmRNA/rRNA uracil-C5-methylase (TrmA/RlmC/RlmD family)